MEILYIHGWRSFFDPTTEKIKSLAKLGHVEGYQLDFTKTHRTIFNEISAGVIQDGGFDLIVGCSLGGYWAAKIGASLGIPFVCLNPSVNPAESMKALIGKGQTFAGDDYELTEKVVDTYTPFDLTGCGLILLDEADTVICAAETRASLRGSYKVVTYSGGHHGFAHMEQALPEIKQLVHIAGQVYG